MRSIGTTRKKDGVTAQVLRTDRILYEVEQAGGDVRRSCDLFGLGIETALRYSATIPEPPATEPQHPVNADSAATSRSER